MSGESNNNSKSSNIEKTNRILFQKYPTSSYTWKDFSSLGVENGTSPGGKLTYAQVPFSHPLFINYRSAQMNGPFTRSYTYWTYERTLVHGQVTKEDEFMYWIDDA